MKMSRILLALLTCVTVTSAAYAQDANRPAASSSSGDEAAIRRQLQSYLEAFNRHDAAEAAKFWSADCVSLAQDSGERIEGRDALQQHFTEFFKDRPTAHLSGQVTDIRIIRPDVASVGGQTTLVVADAEPVVSEFSSVLIKEGDAWLISNSHEHDLSAGSARDALGELEWLVGDWQDQSAEALVTTSFRWSLNQAFLIRSFTVQYPDADPLDGTQVIGWDPVNRQLRTWTFTSDGSFGEGTIARHDDAWVLKMWQVNADGQVASASQIITQIDDDTLTMQTIGETVDGEPLPSSDPVTVVRVAAATSTEGGASTGNEESKP